MHIFSHRQNSNIWSWLLLFMANLWLCGMYTSQTRGWETARQEAFPSSCDGLVSWSGDSGGYLNLPSHPLICAIGDLSKVGKNHSKTSQSNWLLVIYLCSLRIHCNATIKWYINISIVRQI